MAPAASSASTGLDVLLAAVEVDELKNSPQLSAIRPYENCPRGLPSVPSSAPSALPAASFFDSHSREPAKGDRRPRKKRHVSRVSITRSSRPAKKLRHGRAGDGPGAAAGGHHQRASFPALLMAMMTDPESRDVITFLSDGASFIVVQPDALVGRVLPAYLDGPAPTIEQFHEMLVAWGFETKIDPQYRVRIVSHPQFRRGEWDAALRMRPVGASSAEPSPATHARPRPVQSFSESARSVTPPQLPAAVPSPTAPAAHQRRAFPPAPVAWQRDARARSEVRHRLALMALRAEERRRLLHAPRPAPAAPPAFAWSDAELLAATEVTVSAAIDVLRAGEAASPPPSPSAGGRAIDAVELDRLDLMSRHFLGSSMRRLEARRIIWSGAFPLLARK